MPKTKKVIIQTLPKRSTHQPALSSKVLTHVRRILFLIVDRFLLEGSAAMRLMEKRDKRLEGSYLLVHGVFLLSPRPSPTD
jgi:hypothetical protein